MHVTRVRSRAGGRGRWRVGEGDGGWVRAILAQAAAVILVEVLSSRIHNTEGKDLGRNSCVPQLKKFFVTYMM
jgi:hypothetical protein